MRRMKKRMITFILCICIMLTNETVQITQTANKTAVVNAKSTTTEQKEVSGTCGKKLKWKLDLESGELKITGSGKMDKMMDFDDSYEICSPWWKYRKLIKTINIGDYVVDIGDNAFSGLSNLKTVKLGKNINKIGSGAFERCASLESINMSKKIIKIEEVAFAGCTSLKKITIPNTVKEIERGAFYSCESLEKIKIPNSVTKMGYNVFCGCSNLKKITIGKGVKELLEGIFDGDENIETIKVASGNKYYKVIGNILYDKNKKNIICIGKVENDIAKIPSSVTKINMECINKDVKEFSVSEQNKKYCSEDGTLFNKKKNVLVKCSKNVKDSYEIPVGVTNVKEYAFEQCDELKTLVVANDVKKLESLWLNQCEQLKKVEIGAKVVSFGVINCPSLEEFTVSENNTKYSAIEGVLFDKNITKLIEYPEGSNRTSYTIPASVTGFEFGGFGKCDKLEEVEFPGSGEYEYLGSFVFSKCNALKTLKIGNGNIPDLSEVIYSCPNLENLIISEENPYYSTEDNVLYNKEQTELISFVKKPVGEYTVKETVKEIDRFAIGYCKDLTALKLPDNMERVYFYLSGCDNLKRVELGKNTSRFVYEYSSETGEEGYFDHIEEFVVPEENKTYASVDGVIYNKKKTVLYRCGGGKKGKLVIPDGTKKIKHTAFYNCTELTEVVVPKSVKTIPEDCFTGCDAKITKLK